jgi:L-alanine-DL-glutamate epimerase-like enolase superfamily enzyme
MHPLLEDRVTSTPLEMRAGKVGVPQLPGLGVELDQHAVERCVERYRRNGPYPPSGSRALTLPVE